MRSSPLRVQEITARLSTLGEAIAGASPEVDFAYLFGSAATGQLTPRSDVDVAIHAAPGADLFAVQRVVATAVSRHLGTDGVDVILLNRAPIALAGRVLVNRQVLVDRRPFDRHAYESRTARLFQDFRIREHRLLAERAARG